MLKLAGLFIIVASSAKIGFDFAKKYSDRTSIIKSFIAVLEKTKNEINFSNCIITDALTTAADVKSTLVKNLIAFICDCVKKFGITPEEAVDLYIKDNSSMLEKNDMEIIKRFFSLSGKGDKDGEIKNIENAVENLKLNLHTATEDEKKYVKLYRTGGILAGFVIAIILA